MIDIIINIIINIINNIRGAIRFLVLLPFKLANFFIILMGIITTAFLLWWVYSVPPVDARNNGTNG
jgi:hypothetical protein